MIVVDTNVVAYLYIESEFTPRAEALLIRDADWAVPLLWRSEFRNILAGAVRRRRLDYDGALRLLDEAEDMLAGREHEVASREVMAFVRDSRCSAYDCEFVALASRLGVKLATMDARILEAFPRLATPLPG